MVDLKSKKIVAVDRFLTFESFPVDMGCFVGWHVGLNNSLGVVAVVVVIVAASCCCHTSAIMSFIDYNNH